MNHKLIALIAAIFMLTSCGGALEPDASGSLPAPADELDITGPDTAAYAAEMGLSLEEAAKQLADQEGIGQLQQRLQASLPDTFAGLWIEHQPRYRVMVALTEGDRQVLDPYLEGQPFAQAVELASAAYSLRQLTQDQIRVGQAVEAVAAAVTYYVDVQDNRVVLEVANPGLLMADLADAGFTLPETVSVEQMEVTQRQPASNQGAVIEAVSPGGMRVALPVQPPSNASMAALMQGSLHLVDGCLRVSSAADEPGFLVLWPNDTEIQFAGETVELLNSQGEIVARAGEPIRLGGGADESPTAGERLAEMIPGMPLPGCPGPYWFAAPLETMAQQAAADIYSDPFSSGGLLAHFIYQSVPAEAAAEISGELTLDQDKCIRVAGYTVLWPPRVWPREAPLRLVWEGETPLAEFGDTIRIPGSEKGPDDYRYFENKINCPGPYWGAADVLPPE